MKYLKWDLWSTIHRGAGSYKRREKSFPTSNTEPCGWSLHVLFDSSLVQSWGCLDNQLSELAGCFHLHFREWFPCCKSQESATFLRDTKTPFHCVNVYVGSFSTRPDGWFIGHERDEKQHLGNRFCSVKNCSGPLWISSEEFFESMVV